MSWPKVDVLNMLRKFERTYMASGLQEEAADVALLHAAVSELIESLEWALLRIRTSLDTGDRYAEAEAALKRARGDA
jgi:hypothetical protein